MFPSHTNASHQRHRQQWTTAAAPNEVVAAIQRTASMGIVVLHPIRCDHRPTLCGEKGMYKWTWDPSPVWNKNLCLLFFVFGYFGYIPLFGANQNDAIGIKWKIGDLNKNPKSLTEL